MKDNSDEKYLALSLVLNSCLFFSIFSFILWCISSLVVSLTTTFYLKPVINLALVGISLLISIIISIICAKKKKAYLSSKLTIFYYFSVAYTALYFVYNLAAFIMNDIWTVFAIITIFISSILFALIEVLLKIKITLIKATIYFMIFAIPYFTTLFSMGYGKGNELFVILAIYILSFIAVFTSLFIVKSIINKYKNQNIKYEKMFK